jgi:Toprim domain
VTGRPSIEEIKHAARDRILDVLGALGVRERSRGNYISMCNPMAKDAHPSFTIWIKGAAIGAFKDHRGIAQGDVIDLVAYLKGWSAGNDRAGRDQALAWLADFCGLLRLTTSQRAKQAMTSRRQAREAEKKRDEDLAEKQKRAFQIWLYGNPILGSRADTYLRGRGIDLRALPGGPRGGIRLPKIVRCLESHLHTESRRELPCMIAGCVDPVSGKLLAIHRTWLAPNGEGKADVTPAKKVWPDFRGLVIPLWRGETGLSVKAAIAAGLRETLVLTEGIEDGLSAVIAEPRYRTWAMISLGNLVNVAQVLPACIDSVIVHRQREWSNAAAVAAFDRGKAALEASGRPVAIVEAMGGGKDLNDTLRGAA